MNKSRRLMAMLQQCHANQKHKATAACLNKIAAVKT